jgi:colanic acid biosynthesis glycosyl transferase WcaI
MGLVLPAIARLKRAALVLNLQDLHPDAQIHSGIIQNKYAIRFLRAVEAYAYRNTTALTVISEQFRSHAVRRGAAAGRVFVVENWVDVERMRASNDERKAFRTALGIADTEILVLHAGTLGYASGAEVIIDAACLLRDLPNCRFLIVGEGPLLKTLKLKTAEAALATVRFLPFQPESELAAMQSSADLSIVTLAPSFSEVSVPSKLLAYLAAGRAVVAAVPSTSQTAELIGRASAGIVVPPGDGAALAAAIRALASDADAVRRFGSAARAFAEQYFSLDASAGRYESIFTDVCRFR